MKQTARRVVSGPAVVALGLVVLAATRAFSCSEVSCGPEFEPLAVIFALATFLVGGHLLFSRRRR